MGGDDDRDKLPVVGFVLKDGREADGVFAQDFGHLGQHARLIAGHQAQVIAAGEFRGRQNIGGRHLIRENFELLKRHLSGSQRDVD